MRRASARFELAAPRNGGQASNADFAVRKRVSDSLRREMSAHGSDGTLESVMRPGIRRFLSDERHGESPRAMRRANRRFRSAKRHFVASNARRIDPHQTKV